MTDIQLSAGAHAFGDGSHPTTMGVLAALEALDPTQFTPRTACDIGAGSGILSFAIHARFGCEITATDINAQAIETLQENIQKNGLGTRIHPYQADGFSHPVFASAPPFDLITMNILAEPLLALAYAAAHHLAPSGVLILSGILRHQESLITEAYSALGLELATRLTIGNWVTICWQKPE